VVWWGSPHLAVWVGEAMIAPADRWGPFADSIEPGERLARLRTLRAITHLQLGRRGEHLASLLRRAEADPDALAPAVSALNRLAALDRRHVLASFASLHRPA